MINEQELEERIRLVGGKGAHLEWLSSLAEELGYKVPEFNVVDTTIFDEVLNATGISRKIEVIREFAPQVLNGTYNVDELTAIAERESLYPMGAEEFRRNLNWLSKGGETPKSFLSDVVNNLSLTQYWHLPENLQNRLEAIHSPFNKKKYVMRSSVTCEDGKEDSFAGIFRTTGPKVLIRDLHHMELQDYDFNEFLLILGWIYGDFLSKREVYLKDRIKSDDKMAICLQRFVHTNPSGVVFTRLPEEPNILTLETVADTCNWVVDGNGTYIMDFNRKTGKVDEEIALADIQNPLTKEQVKKVYTVSTELEKRYGQPLDIEFGFFEGELYLLQARPIVKESKPELIRIIQGDLDIIAKTPLCINRGNGEGILAKYSRLTEEINKAIEYSEKVIQEVKNLDAQIDKQYILMFQNYRHAWAIQHIVPKGKCVGAIVVGDKHMSRVCHNSHYFRNSKVPVLGLKGIEKQVDSFLINITPDGIKYSDVTFGVHSVGRRGIFYRK